MATPVVTITPDTPQVTITPDAETTQAPSVLDKANEYAGKALTAAGLPTSLSNVPDWFKHLTGTHPNSEPFWAPVREAIKNPTQENIVNAVPFIGPSSVAMSKDVQKGDYGGAAATLAGTIGTGVLPSKTEEIASGLSKAGDAASAVKGAAANTLRTEEGTLKPSVQLAAKSAGAATGGMLGGGWGALVGEHLGPNLADVIIPNRPKGAPSIRTTPFDAPVGTEELTKPSGPTPPPRKITLGPSEDLGLGLGNDHVITNAKGERIGSAQIEPKNDGTVHVHWLGGDFSNYGRSDVMGAIKEAYPDAEKITYDRRRLAKGDAAATTQPRQMNVSQAPSVNDVANQVVANTTGVKPLEPSVPLNKQGIVTPKPEISTPVSGETDPLKIKYPDPAQRQMVRANGEKIVQAIGADADTMKAVHDLTRVDLRQALVNSGEDMGQRTVSNSKFAGEGSITREDAFNKLLAKGHSPADIIRLAKQVPQ